MSTREKYRSASEAKFERAMQKQKRKPAALEKPDFTLEKPATKLPRMQAK